MKLIRIILIATVFMGAYNLNSFSQITYIDLNMNLPDVSHCFTNSSIENTFKRENILLFPNPTTGYIKIEINNLNKNKTYFVKITNINGQVLANDEIHAFSNKYTKDYDFTDYSKGLYFIIIYNSKHKYVSKILIK